MSSFDLGNCTNVLKEHYGIEKEENLIILNMETKIEKNESENNNNDESFKSGRTTQIEIFDKAGNQLDLSICNEKIKIYQCIDDMEELDLESAKDFSNQGIGIYNPEHDFFNDLCYQYNSTDGKDITINDRKNIIYKNIYIESCKLFMQCNLCSTRRK